MKRNPKVDIALAAAAIILLVACAFLVKPWVSADSIALIRPGTAASPSQNSSGLLDRCRSCNDGALRQLGLTPGVAWVKQDPRNNLLVVAFDSRTVRPDAIAAGLTASGVTGSVAGVMGIRQYCGRKIDVPGTPGTHPCGPGCRQFADIGDK